MPERASLQELLDFANRVREAGGGNPLDALMPAVPEDMSQCLIAKNLNFNCGVNSHAVRDEYGVRVKGPDGLSLSRWHMSVSDEATRDKIAAALGLEKYDDPEDGTDPVTGDYVPLEYGVVLPEEIGQVAHDFDNVLDVASRLEDGLRISQEEKALFEDMWPYIDASVKEAYELATVVNEDGSIVL